MRDVVILAAIVFGVAFLRIHGTRWIARKIATPEQYAAARRSGLIS